MKRIGLIICIGGLLALACQPGFATLMFSGSSGSLAASAGFTVSGTNLEVVLANTSTADVLVPSDVLTALFFDLAGSPALSRTSAVLASGSTVVYDSDGQPAGGVVGGEWAYKKGLSGTPGGAQGISSSGFGLFGPKDLFPGPDLAPPASPDGANYGILSAGDNIGTGNAGVTGAGGQIKNSVVFTLSGLPTGFTADRAHISNVAFQYGTALTEPSFEEKSVPEPASCALLALAVGGVGAMVRRRRK